MTNRWNPGASPRQSLRPDEPPVLIAEPRVRRDFLRSCKTREPHQPPPPPRRLRQVYIVERRPVSPGAHCTPSPPLVGAVGDRCEASSVLERTSSLR